MRGQIDTFKVVQIIYDKWGMWFAGQKEKKGPSKYGYPDSIGVGVAPKTPEETTGVGSQQAVANSQRTIMKNALEGGDGSVGEAALNIRKVLNQADAADKGAKKSDFGGNFFMDLLSKGENTKISDAFMKSSDQKKGLDAFALAQDNEGLTNFLYKKGANEEQATNYMNLIDGDLFTKTPLFNNDDKFSFSTNFKIGNSLYTKDVLFELCPDLFYLIYQYREKKISIFKNDKILDKITKKLTNFKCSIEINGNLKINVTLTSNSDNNLSNLDKQKQFMPNMLIYNLKDLNSFVNSKNSFENLSIFTYYPYKLFQEVLYE